MKRLIGHPLPDVSLHPRTYTINQLGLQCRLVLMDKTIENGGWTDKLRLS